MSDGKLCIVINMAHLFNHPQARFEAILAQLFVGQRHTHAVFAEPRWFDAQLPE